MADRPAHRQRRPAAYVDRNRRTMLILSLLLAAVVIAVSVVTLSLAGPSDRMHGEDSAEQSAALCRLMFPDDQAQVTACIENAP
ncbi:hypothetical protein [Kineosporia mesophila]|uniref:hypothetical protein n=1 Tax=Kineosporia mesophila TaxID=566012 RepID=UPI001E416B8F|nr:hypothetical protein [Kineosporia mesophila]MCD5355158.1 hypothetical protein [Kineosporia mesophila]